MTDTRTAILDAVRDAIRDVPADEPAIYKPPPASAPAIADLDLLAERLADYGATVTKVAMRDGVADAVASAFARHNATRIATPPGLPIDLRPGRPVELLVDDPPLPVAALSVVDGVLTTAAFAIAETGTIILDGGPGQGRRALTLLPDLHVCVVTADQVRQGITETIADLSATTRPITLISGPSATSDIEFERVEGVHGPRRLEVVLVCDRSSAAPSAPGSTP